VQHAASQVKYAISVGHGSAIERAESVMRIVKERLPHAVEYIMTDISPALSVHTGPGLIGIAVQALPV
jgi:fatty acid-binding protein DegV